MADTLRPRRHRRRGVNGCGIARDAAGRGAEVRWLVAEEWAVTADDILWRRTKLGLCLSTAEKAAPAEWLASSRT